MKKFLKVTAIVLITLIALVAAAVLWATLRLAHDDNGIARPTYKHYEMGQGAADGTPAPSAVGYVVDSAGRGRIVPPMPPATAILSHLVSCLPGQKPAMAIFNAAPATP